MTYSIMKLGSPAAKKQQHQQQLAHKRASKCSDSSHVSMTTSTAEENPFESNFFSWMRLFRFASLLCRAE